MKEEKKNASILLTADGESCPVASFASPERRGGVDSNYDHTKRQQRLEKGGGPNPVAGGKSHPKRKSDDDDDGGV